MTHELPHSYYVTTQSTVFQSFANYSGYADSVDLLMFIVKLFFNFHLLLRRIELEIHNVLYHDMHSVHSQHMQFVGKFTFSISNPESVVRFKIVDN